MNRSQFNPPLADDAAQGQLPALLITIDTEGDNLWSSPRDITTENARFLGRFQALCERYDQRPTYLTNWEMVQSAEYVEFARDAAARGTAEIGMHLHAWNNPPLVPLTDDDGRWLPYLIEYPAAVMREKIARITDALRTTFDQPIVSHRAGRWAFNETYARLLIEHDYCVDCSVTPYVSWQGDRGAPQGRGGVDYRQAPSSAYWISDRSVLQAGDTQLLEIPMTIHRAPRSLLATGLRGCLGGAALGRRLVERFWPEVYWLRPNRRNGSVLRRILDDAEDAGHDYVELMLHSSELMPGGSPYFPDERSIERLYADLEQLFAASQNRFRGMTLRQYHDGFARRAGRALAVPLEASPPSCGGGGA